MWPLCTANSFVWSLLPLLIGFLTGWWAWAHYRAAEPAYAAPEPVRAKPTVVDETVTAVRDAGTTVAGTAASFGGAALGAVAGLGTAAAGALTAIGIPAAVGAPDDLTLIKGVGEKLNDMLNGLGVRRFDQIAAWTPADVDTVDAHLGTFSGRIARDSWIDQAKLLARGAIAEFEAKYGTLGSENK